MVGKEGFVPQLETLLDKVRRRVPEVEPRSAAKAQTNGALLIDVREPEEWSLGVVPGAFLCSRSTLEARLEAERVPALRPLVLMCGSGRRSLLAAALLLDMGFEHVVSVRGGYSQWQLDGLPHEVPDLLPALDRERYRRHLLLPQVGEAGQLRLKKARVAVVGAGGLGSPAAFYLAAAGVGTLTLIDSDWVERSNLQRQILHRDADVGRLKVQSARDTLSSLNPTVTVDCHSKRLTAANAHQLLSGHDVVVDASDNYATRYVLNDVCAELGVPLVHGSVFRFEGQITVFWPGGPSGKSPCYRCLFPRPVPEGLVPACSQAGVLGVLPGIVGSAQALETLKILLSMGDLLVGRVLVFDALSTSFTEFRLPRSPTCPVCRANGHRGAAEVPA
jgi:molybdopterin/thiamine biosynthesis adenylyltransferase/rhodanese-related sulfurtransferase